MTRRGSAWTRKRSSRSAAEQALRLQRKLPWRGAHRIIRPMEDREMLSVLLLAALTAATGTVPQRAALTGVVHNEAGQPVPGATVFICTAWPRKCVETFSPKHYPDC